MAGCSGITEARARCRAIAISGNDYCHAHHPDRADARRRSARKGGKRGGRGRPLAELHSIRGRIETLVEDVLEGRVDRGDAAVVGQLYNTLIRAVATELKVREINELEGRLEELESAIERSNRSRGYGA
jgi:hypothetical protein